MKDNIPSYIKNDEHYILFNKCLEGNFDIPEYMSIKPYIERVVKFYGDTKKFQKDREGIYTRDCMKKIYGLFKYINEHKNFEDLDNYISLIFGLQIDMLDFSDILRTFLYKGHTFISRSEYYEGLKKVCHSINMCSFHSSIPLRIAKILNIYNDSRVACLVSDTERSSWERTIFYEKYVPYMIGHFYRTDMEADKFKIILDKFVDNIDEIITKSKLNGISDLNHMESSVGYFGEEAFTKSFIEKEFTNKKGIK